ncbi:MAG: hypothetical protein ACR2NM_17450 [Bythopirellula sp.]
MMVPPLQLLQPSTGAAAQPDAQPQVETGALQVLQLLQELAWAPQH